MDFWDKEAHQLAANRRRKAKDLWLPPPMIAGEAFPVYKKHSWDTSVSFEDSNSSIFEALHSYRMIGYWIGLLPVQGVLGGNPQHLQWLSTETSVSVMFITVFAAVIAYRVYTGIRYSILGTVESAAYIAGPLFWGFFTLRQATMFPALIRKWIKVENEMNMIGNLSNLKRHLNIITVLNIFATIGTIACVHMTWYEHVAICSEDIIVKMQLTLVSSFKNIFFVPVHTLNWGAPIAFFIQNYYRIIWMFSELTFMVFSYSLYRLFKLYFEHLERFRGKNMSEQFWYQMRVRYHSLSRLTKHLDHFLSPNTCITFAIDIFFICFALFRVFTTNPLKHIKLVYFMTYAILRTLSISLLGSYINDLSRKPLFVLYHVPSQSFCSEALRFQLEILADDIALTGCRFFSITRSFVIAVVGTIVTYEVVLLQFYALRNEVFNTTSFCSAFASEYLGTANISLHRTTLHPDIKEDRFFHFSQCRGLY